MSVKAFLKIWTSLTLYFCIIVAIITSLGAYAAHYDILRSVAVTLGTTLGVITLIGVLVFCSSTDEYGCIKWD